MCDRSPGRHCTARMHALLEATSASRPAPPLGASRNSPLSLSPSPLSLARRAVRERLGSWRQQAARRQLEEGEQQGEPHEGQRSSMEDGWRARAEVQILATHIGGARLSLCG
jgi:hypothetical protein